MRTFTGSPRRAERGPEGGTDHADTVVDLVTTVAAGERARASGDDQKRNLWRPNDLRNPPLEAAYNPRALKTTRLGRWPSHSP